MTDQDKDIIGVDLTYDDLAYNCDYYKRRCEELRSELAKAHEDIHYYRCEISELEQALRDN